MNDNHARALTFAALVALKEALSLAKTPEDFLAEADAIVGNPDNQLLLPFETEKPEPLIVNLGTDKGKDVDNAPLVYEYLGALDRSNASDRRLWTFLAFSTYRDYMEQRWPLSSTKDNWQSRVLDRWLMPNATRGKLVRHGIARLWWVSSLTYDAKRIHPLSQSSDSFEYTREVFKREDRLNSLFDREIGANSVIVRAVLEHAAQGDGYGTDKHLRALMVELTLAYGYRDIGVLDPASARALVAESAPPIKSKKIVA